MIKPTIEFYQNRYLTLDECKDVLDLGYKVTHTYFLEDEYIYLKDGMIYTEEGYPIEAKAFWQYKNKDTFGFGWKLF